MMTSARTVFVAATAAIAACGTRGGTGGDAPPPIDGGTSGIPPAAQGERIGPAPPSSATFVPPAASEAGGVAPRVRIESPVLSNAGLPSEVVQRIVRMNAGRFRLCYENGLRGDPTLAGRIEVKFVIKADGSVGTVTASAPTFDAGTRVCVEKAFTSMAFPAPSPPKPVAVTQAIVLAQPLP